VITDNTEWSCDGDRRNGLFGILLPYIWDLHVTEIRKLEEVLPLPADEAATLVLQLDRIDVDLATLRSWYPDLRFEFLHGRTGQRRVGLVIIEKDLAARPHLGAGDNQGDE
jgi:hypothetical protein